MRVLIITNQFPPRLGGVAAATLRLSKALLAIGDKAEVITRNHTDHTPPGFGQPETTEFEGIRVHRFPDRWFKRAAYGLCISELIRIANEFCPDVIHAYYAVPSGYLAIACGNRVGVPVVVSCRGDDVTKAILHKPATLRRVLESADFVTSVSSSLLVWAHFISEFDQYSTVRNSIEPSFLAVEYDAPAIRAKYGLMQGSIVLASNAVFRWKKGPDYLEDLLVRVGYSDIPNIEFVLIGKFNPSWHHKLRRRFQSTATAGRTRKLVSVPCPDRRDLARLLSIVDLFLLTSRREGMPNVAIEAMSRGTPVAATAVNGCVELLENADAGILLNPFDSVEGARAVVALLSNPSQLMNLGKNARHLIETDYLVEREVRTLRSIYEQLSNQ
ncbi:MAG: glycosyltransferase family 4 protein [Anaerolineae bacterium]|nr:glycosyltransferase family 4 protein [Anaerolineae bacterium]